MASRPRKPDRKEEIITFKADAALSGALRGIANRSAFIRAAIVASLDGTCPLCRGTGAMTRTQRTHWNRFARRHSVQECGNCHSVHLVCADEPRAKPKARSACR